MLTVKTIFLLREIYDIIFQYKFIFLVPLIIHCHSTCYNVLKLHAEIVHPLHWRFQFVVRLMFGRTWFEHIRSYDAEWEIQNQIFYFAFGAISVSLILAVCPIIIFYTLAFLFQFFQLSSEGFHFLKLHLHSLAFVSLYHKVRLAGF